MTPTELLHSAGIYCYPDSADIEHLRYGPQVRRRSYRFECFQRYVLTTPSEAGIYAARLVALDLVRPSELADALRVQPYRLHETACVEWSAAGSPRLDRRALCSFTTLAMGSRAPAAEEELSAMLRLLDRVEEYRVIAATDRLTELEQDFACWAAQRLPRVLWAHVTGLRPLTALSRQCVAMGDTAGVPRLSVDEAQSSQHAEAADMLDTALAEGRASTTPVLVELAVAVFKMKEGEDDKETLRRWARDLLALRTRIEAGDVASAVLVAWQFDVVQNGTLTQVDAALGTRASYVRLASLPLWRILAPLPPDPRRWDRETLRAGYLAAMGDPACKDKRKLGAAISSFQSFLQEAFGLPALPLGLHKLIPAAAPRAQWLPESAVSRAVRWIEEDSRGDPRLLMICALMIRLAYVIPARFEELLWLRLKNLSHLSDGSMEIEIAPRRGKNLKTAAATRRVQVNDPATVAKLSILEKMREHEGASTGELLFADALNGDSPYRRHAVHVTILRVLKLATGDASMTFHALRHTHVSNAVEQILRSPSLSICSRLAKLADSTGHEVAATTLSFYAHRFEFALRTQLDKRLAEHVLTNANGSSLLGRKANSLTVAAKRSHMSLTDFVWRDSEAKARDVAVTLPSSADRLDLHEPDAPSFAGPLARQYTLWHCVRTIQLLKVLPRDQVCHRLHLTDSNLDLIDDAADKVLSTIYSARRRLPPSDASGVLDVMEYLEIRLDRTSQPRYEALRRAMTLPQDAALIADGATAWMTCWWKGELSAEDPEALLPLLLLLRLLDVSASSLLLTFEEDSSDPDSVAALKARAAHVAIAAFHDHVPTTSLPRVRGDRPCAYLVWPSHEGVGAAGRSNRGFDALMFATAVWSCIEFEEWK